VSGKPHSQVPFVPIFKTCYNTENFRSRCVRFWIIDMDDIVPGALQHLREADVIGLAGLAEAALGQEYCRSGYVATTKRRGMRLSGVVTLPGLASSAEPDQQTGEKQDLHKTLTAPARRFEVEVEVADRNSCEVICTCGKRAAFICAHAAALLYQWINQPYAFVPLPPGAERGNGVVSDWPVKGEIVALKSRQEHSETVKQGPSVARYAPLALSPRHQPAHTVEETLAQLGLSELRALAREYGITPTGMSKQQLSETMIETLCQPEAVRRVVGTLEKPQRQLLAAFALAGGSLSDEDLRGLFERFSLGNSGTLQDMLLALQAKLLIVRNSFNHSLQQRFNLSASSLDISWYIPREVRESLHVTLPITPFNVEVPYGKGANPSLPTLHHAQPYKLLEDLLLIARALDGFVGEPAEKSTSRSGSLLAGGRVSSDGSLALPPPDDLPALPLIEHLRATAPRSPAFLRFAVRLLRLAPLLTREEGGQTHLRALPAAARLLLGPTRLDILHDLFTRWLKQTSYAELYELTENGLRVRCRSTPLNQPDLRRGELEQENSEARQDLLALLAQVPVGEWVNFSAFARFIYRLRPTFLQHRQQLFPSPHWWIEQEEGHPLRPTQLADWLRAEGRYLAHLIQGPLHWWGLCDLAISVHGQLLAFRLTSMTGFLFHGLIPSVQDQARETDAPVAPALTVSPEGDVLIPCRPTNWPLIAIIEDFAESKGVRDEKLVYVLTARSLGEAIGRGCDPQTLLALLRSFDGSGEGKVLRDLLESMERRIANYGRVRLYTDVPLLQTADSSVLQQLTALTSLDEHIIRPIQPTLFLLRKRGVGRLVEELKRRGLVPLVHEEV
jgi:hypothetical protein